MNNTDSCTDEDLLNLVNNTILKKTNFTIDMFTGGYVSMTSTRGHTKETFKVALLFGYKNRNSQSFTFEISKDHVFIWTKAFLTKLASIQVDEIGMDFNELHGLMKTPEDVSYDDSTSNRTTDSTMTHCISTSYLNTSISLPPTSELGRTTGLKNFMEIKNTVMALVNQYYIENKQQMSFVFNEKAVSFSTKGIAYYRETNKNLDYQEQDQLITYIFNEYLSKGAAS